jgi:hypothetical protein
MKTNKNSRSQSSDRCRFPFADGRRCHMLRHPKHPALCLFHSRQEQQLLESHHLGEELSTSFTGDFLTASDINHVMSKLFCAVAQDRISESQGRTLARIGATLLRSIPDVKDETHFEYSFDSWQRMIKNSIRLSRAMWPGLETTLTPENAGDRFTPAVRTANIHDAGLTAPKSQLADSPNPPPDAAKA